MWSFWNWTSSDKKKAEAEAALRAHQQRVIEHNERNFRKGALGVAVTGAAAILSAVFCRRSIIARRYVPRKFNANIHPPKFNPMKDAARAVVDATMLSTSLFCFTVAAGFWVYGAGSLKELGSILTSKYSPERKIVSDPESAKVERDLSQLLFSKQSSTK